MRARPVALGAAAAFITLLAARDGLALGPFEMELAGKAGLATNDYGFGGGGRAGITVFGVYGGFNIVDYPGSIVGCPGQSTSQVLTYGGEVGYGIKIAFLTIRPLVGFGDWSYTPNGPCQSYGQGPFPFVPTNSFYLQPGGTLLVNLRFVIFGADASALVPTSSTSSSAFVISAELGVRF
jgi:hypothetical protein